MEEVLQGRKWNLVISDMATKLSGIADSDARAGELIEWPAKVAAT